MRRASGARAWAAALLISGVLLPAGRLLAQSSIPVPAVSGDQLLFFYDARSQRVPFLSISNPADQAVNVAVAFYDETLANRIAEAGVTLAAEGDQIIDPTSFAGGAAVGHYGIATVTPVATAGGTAPVVPPAPLTGGFTLANVGLGAAFGENPLGRVAVTGAGAHAAAGTAVDGSTVRYQRLSPAVLTVPVFYDPTTLAPPAQDGNRVILAAFADSYGSRFDLVGAHGTVAASFFDNAGQRVREAQVQVNGVVNSNLQELASPTALASSGKVFFTFPDVGAPLGTPVSFLGVFSQSLATFASGQRMPAVAAVPSPGPAPSITPTPQPTPTASAGTGSVCGNGIIEGDEECDGTNLFEQTCDDVVGGGDTTACSGTLKCTPQCKLDTSACSCPCQGDEDCFLDVDCSAFVPHCTVYGVCQSGMCATSTVGTAAICNGNDPEFNEPRCQ